MKKNACAKCGLDLNMVGRAHNCRPRAFAPEVVRAAVKEAMAKGGGLVTVDTAGRDKIVAAAMGTDKVVDPKTLPARAPRTNTGAKINVKSKTPRVARTPEEIEAFQKPIREAMAKGGGKVGDRKTEFIEKKTRGPLPVGGGGGGPPPVDSGMAPEAGRPLTQQFLLQLFVDQAEWIEDHRKKFGLRSRAEAIRRLLDSAMGWNDGR